MAIAAPQPRVLADVFARSWVRNAVLVVGGAAFIGLAAQVSFYLPWNPAVPVTLQTFAVILAAGALGSLRGVLATTLYLALAFVGVPWLTADAEGGHATGSAVLSLNSFGYLAGFIVAAFVVGKVAEHGATRTFWRSVGLMLLGSAIIYAVGATWLKFKLGIPWFGPESAWAYGVKDFLIGDTLKLLAAAGLLPLTWAALKKAGLTR